MLVLQLLRLGSSIIAPQPLWQFTREVSTRHMELTNLTPLVVFGRVDQGIFLDRMIAHAWFAPRRLMILGDQSTVIHDDFHIFEPDLDPARLRDLPLERIGADRLKARMLAQS